MHDSTLPKGSVLSATTAVRRTRASSASTFLVAGLAALFASPALLAQPGPPLKRLDQDGDGMISREEFFSSDRAPGMRMLERADANSDGAVTRDELQAAIDRAAEEHRTRAEQRMERRFAELDEDGDGLVVRDEVLERAFYRLDGDGDGFISESEAQKAQDRRHQRRVHRADGPAEPFDAPAGSS